MLCGRPAGASHAVMDPIAGGKVAYSGKFLSAVDKWVNKRILPRAGHGNYGSAIGTAVKGEETGDECAVNTAAEETGFRMRDLLFVLVYLAMVVTPAVVAVRSGRATGTDD